MNEKPLNKEKVIWFAFKCKRNKDRLSLEYLKDNPLVLESLIFSERDILEDSQKSDRNIYPGLVFIKTYWRKGTVDKELKDFIKKYNGFAYFQSYSYKTRNDPVLISPKEIDKMINSIKSVKEKKIGKFTSQDIDFQINDFVTVLTGVFRGYEGEVVEIDYNTGIITLNIEFFGRITPIQVGFKECKRIN